MRVLFLITILLLMALPATAQSDTTIAYQGQLQDASGPHDGTPGMEFRLFDSLTDGAQIGTEIVLSAVPVTDGLFEVDLDFGAPYGAEPTYLEVMVAGETLAPRQRILAAPLAIHALSLDTAYADNRFWKLDGNSGTDPANDYLGTTDAVPLEFRVEGSRVLRIEPLPEDLPFPWQESAQNITAGWSQNSVDNGVIGATIGGGGGHRQSAVAWPNRVSGHFGTVSGGLDNAVSGFYGTVGGGNGNRALHEGATVAGGYDNQAIGWKATIGGGNGNDATADETTVGGGGRNDATGSASTVSGGMGNTASGIAATVPGGDGNTASGSRSFAVGYRAQAIHDNAFVWSDSSHTLFESTGADQFLINAAGGVGIGTNSPARDLHIKQRSTNNGQIGLQIERSDNFNNWGLYIATSDNLGFRYNDVLKSRIDADDGVYSTSSDRNAKKDIQTLSGVLGRVLKLKPRTYLMKEQDESALRSPGFIAQEVQPLFPATVAVQDGEYALKYSQITVLNTAALIELNEHFSSAMASLESESEKRFAALESANTDLRARVAALSSETRKMQALVDRNRALEERLASLESLILEGQQVAEQ
ncbi:MULTISPECIES: tail fiber domain-containing protein [unclassified Wenzhouxiangella]|uniref:tail fiber domain-containing protein n=1 Tax=unclassified Wenzhouxiangella TaxID=2613841 RepID=UPI000E32A414|nr:MULTISPECIES: tail fiber domain-containing protein [unclassified Wenzhouxiangella]RFF26552.1 hypothetical protein DZK25_12465 [Wenzhouxiangella sp. 15181]RFP69353.1 hypothetical protein DZK26_04270 [Wenzhouxiangella sp. 15190]